MRKPSPKGVPTPKRPKPMTYLQRMEAAGLGTAAWDRLGENFRSKSARLKAEKA